MSEAPRIRQNFGWLAAEFVVIVLGVMTAFAADQWNQNRQDEQTEIGYLERLKANLESDTTIFARAIEVNGMSQGVLTAFLDVVDGTEPFPTDHVDFVAGLNGGLSARFDGPRRDTYNELINSHQRYRRPIACELRAHPRGGAGASFPRAGGRGDQKPPVPSRPDPIEGGRESPSLDGCRCRVARDTGFGADSATGRVGSGNQIDGTGEDIRRQQPGHAPVEGGQRTPVPHCQREQVGICDLTISDGACEGRAFGVRRRHVVGPELMPR